jgi:hypothetical protein
MLTPNFGAGSAMFKYWSGLYRRQEAALVVSNGVGNWMPVRVNAPRGDRPPPTSARRTLRIAIATVPPLWNKPAQSKL